MSSDYAFSRVSSVNSLVSIAPSVTSLASSRRSSSGDSIQGYTKHGTTSSKKRRATRPEDDTSSSSSTGESAHACQQRGYRGKNNVAMQNTQGHMVQCGWRGETKQRPNNKQGDGSKPGCGLEYTKLEIATAQCQYDNFSRALYRLLGLRDQDMARIGPLLRYFPTEVCATEEQLAKLDSTLVGAISSDEQLARRVAALRPDLAPRLLRGFTPPSTPM
ncbi:hypothetical protein H2203_005833 [Taxawa tesnikishii (nom. ined.)]|nr:hypothetical protein H2203_005833 [Dothideales sp. JES 119]